MAKKVKPRVKAPKKAKKGEIIMIKSLISHGMESGQRKNKQGKKIPRNIINKFSATFNGKEFFSSDWHPSVSANPYMAFNMRAEESGEFEFTWVADDGKSYAKKSKMTVG